MGTIEYFRIVSPRFVAGGELKDGAVARAAPIIKYMIGWTKRQVHEYALKRQWAIEWGE